jgi:hypothetical protein
MARVKNLALRRFRRPAGAAMRDGAHQLRLENPPLKSFIVRQKPLYGL